jgi:hypothetical protein
MTAGLLKQLDAVALQFHSSQHNSRQRIAATALTSPLLLQGKVVHHMLQLVPCPAD